MSTLIKNEVFDLDGTTQLEFLEPNKTIVVIDKDKFFVCKQLINDNATDSEIAEYLSIGEDKVKYFKYKMQLFEDEIRTRRRALKPPKKKAAIRKDPVKKREMSAEERFRRARDLIAQNLPTNQISKILKISERSVTRFKRRMRDERKRLRSEGRIPATYEDDDEKFKHLKPGEKIRKAHELFRQNLRIPEIAEVLKISERSVRRWKDRLENYKCDEDVDLAQECEENEFDLDETEKIDRPRKKRKFSIDREKVEYAKELIENKLSNKDMSLLLEMSIACVRKLKLKILDGTVEELIDNNEEYYRNLDMINNGELIVDPEIDPLQTNDTYLVAKSTKPERKPKVLLRDRDGKIARLLRENNVRTMDIAKMMNISERSVTRLLAKFRDVAAYECDSEVVEEVEKLLVDKDILLNSDVCQVDYLEDPANEDQDNSHPQSQFSLCVSLLSMHVKIKDIAKMLDISEKKVLKWKHQYESEDQLEEEDEDDDE